MAAACGGDVLGGGREPRVRAEGRLEPVDGDGDVLVALLDRGLPRVLGGMELDLLLDAEAGDDDLLGVAVGAAAAVALLAAALVVAASALELVCEN